MIAGGEAISPDLRRRLKGVETMGVAGGVLSESVDTLLPRGILRL